MIGGGCERYHVYNRTRVLGDVAFQGGRRAKDVLVEQDEHEDVPFWQDFEIIHMDDAFSKAMKSAIASGRECAPTEVSREPGTKRPVFIHIATWPRRRSIFADIAEFSARPRSFA